MRSVDRAVPVGRSAPDGAHGAANAPMNEEPHQAPLNKPPSHRTPAGARVLRQWPLRLLSRPKLWRVHLPRRLRRPLLRPLPLGLRARESAEGFWHMGGRRAPSAATARLACGGDAHAMRTQCEAARPPLKRCRTIRGARTWLTRREPRAVAAFRASAWGSTEGADLGD